MPESPSRFAAFLAELRHRRVFRVAAVYACVSFIIIQIIDGAFDYLRIPEWIGTTIIVLLALGFFIAVGMAWAFDLTDKGIVRTRGKTQVSATSRRPILTNWTLGIVAALAIIVAAWALLRQPSSGGGPITSIAVLPLENLMNDPEQDYFVDGMHDALISELGKLGALRVIGRTSVLGYRNAPKPIPEIAQELKVDAVVEGSVLLVGGEVKITVQLVAASPERHLWTDSYTRSVNNVLSLHSEVAQAIAREIKVTLTPEEEADLASAPQVNPEAYDLYLKGWHLRSQETGEAMSKAVEYLEQAVALDSTFARAWAALAHCYFQLTGWRGLLIYDTAIRGKQALDKALALDPNEVQAIVVLGIFKVFGYFDLAGAEASFRRALELDPDNVNALYEYGLFLSRTGRLDEALAKMELAQELDPLSTLPLYGFGWIYHFNRKYSKAQEYYQAVLELQPGFSMFWPRRNERALLMQQGRYAEAAAEAEKAEDFWLQLRAEWALGNREKVYAVRDSLRSTGELQRWEQEDPYWAAWFYTIMGEKEEALSLLEKASEDPLKNPWYTIGLVYDQEFDFLRAEPRFKAILEKMGLTEVFDQYGQRIR